MTTKKLTHNVSPNTSSPQKYVIWMENILLSEADQVGIANAHIGQLFTDLKSLNINIPHGFAVNVDAFSKVMESPIMKELIISNLDDLENGNKTLPQAALNIQRAILELPLPPDLETEIIESYHHLSLLYDEIESDVMIRSSGTHTCCYNEESMQRHPSILNLRGANQIIKAYKECISTLFSEQALIYRKKENHRLIPHSISMGVQKMIHSDLGVSGTLFTQDPDTGFPDTLIINASYGIGKLIVKGHICPDEYRVFKPLLYTHTTGSIIKKSIGDKNIREVCAYDPEHPVCIENTNYSEQQQYALTNEQICQLARWACEIESTMNRPLNIEWAIDGETQKVYVIQIHTESIIQHNPYTLTYNQITEKNMNPISSGLAIGNKIVHGTSSIRSNPSDPESFKENSILVTSEITPDWLPFLNKSAGIVTEKGGRNSYVANLCRELNLPAIIGTKNITNLLKQDQAITLDCASSEIGTIYRHHLEYETSEININNILRTSAQRKLSIDNPNAAQTWWKLPHQGIGMAKIESIILNDIGIHPMALIHYAELEDEGLKKKILDKTSHYDTPSDYFVDTLAKGIAQMAAVCFPDTMVLRFSHFSSKDYIHISGSSLYEPYEENALLGIRGASRYLSPHYREAFDLECQAVLKARETMGFKNIDVAVPFCRTTQEAKEVGKIIQQNGLIRGDDGFEVHLIVEVPSNIFLAKEFTNHFDQFAIDLDTLTQLILGLDPQADSTHRLFDHYNPAILAATDQLVSIAHKEGVSITVFGLLDDHRSKLMEFLIRAGVDAFAFEPENFVRGSHQVYSAEELFTIHHILNPNQA